MLKTRHYLLLAVFAYLLFMLTSVPAHIIEKPVNTHTPVRLQAVTGSLWQGHVQSISFNNIQLNDTQWDINLWKIITGRLSADIETHLDDEKITAEVGSSFLGKLFVNDLTGNITADKLSQYANIPLAKLDGMVELNIESARWAPGSIPLAHGQIKWNSAMVTVAESASLGNVTIDLAEVNDTLEAKLNNQGGDIRISGQANVSAEADYSLDVSLIPTNSASTNIRQSLGLFAQRKPDGSYQLTNKGSLKQLGLM
jgi:general secretion pathway protein N